MAIKVKFDAKKAIKGFVDMAKRMGDTTGLKIIAEMGRKGVLDNFRYEADPKNKPWKDWKNPEYRSGSGKILQDTGRLRNSIMSRVIKSGAIVFTDVKYAAVHNKGSRKKKIPRRKFMGLDSSWMEKIAKFWAFYFVRGKKK